MAVITKKDGRIFCVWRDDEGKQIWESFGRGRDAGISATERDLEVKLGKVRAKHGQKTCYGDITFKVLAQDYIDIRASELSPKTRHEIIRVTTVYAFPLIGDQYVSSISMEDLSRLEKKFLWKGLSVTTVNRYTHYIAKIFSWGVDRDMIGVNPWSKRKPLRSAKKTRIELFTLEEFIKILEVAPDHLRWALEVAYHTGMRPGPSELFALKWSDINWETGGIRIYSSKTDSVRIQYVSRKFLQKMKERMETLRQSEELCDRVVSYRGRPVNKLRRSWLTAKTDAGIDRHIRLYDIRHFYATHALARGANILDLAHRMGHVNPDMIVRVYSHLAEEIRQKKALDIPDLYKRKRKRKAAAKIVPQKS